MLDFYLSLVTTEEDRDKVERIYLDYYSVMKYEASKYLKSSYDIEDIVHESIIAVINNLSCVDIDNEVSTRSFCKVITKNKAIDFLRKKNKETISETDESIEAVGDNPEEIIINDDSYNRLVEVIKSMSDTYKDVMYLKYVNGLKEWQISEVLGLNPKTVSLRIFRGKQILRDILRKELANG